MLLRVLTLNTWGLPAPFARHLEARSAAVAGRLGDAEVDVAAFQEVWTEPARRRLCEGGKQAGLAHSWHTGRRFGSGLLLLSRFPLEELRFTPFRLCGLPQRIQHGDWWADKGFVQTRVATPGGPVALVNTHLHASYAADGAHTYAEHRVAEVVQLSLALRRVEEPLVALGDFNIREEQPEYPILTGLAGLEDVAARLGRIQPTIRGENPYQARGLGHAPDERIDYVLLRPGVGRGISARRIDRWWDDPLCFDGEAGSCSDHDALRAELELGGSGRPLEPPCPDAAERARVLLEAGLGHAVDRRRRERRGGLASLATAAVGALAGGGAGAAALTLGVLGAAAFGALAELAAPRELAGYDSSRRELSALVDGGLAGED